MIATMIIVSLGMLWLGYESDWLRVQLSAHAILNELLYDIELDCDNSDSIFIPDYELQLKDDQFEAAYEAWLAELYAPKYTWWPQAGRKLDDIDRRDKWMTIEDDLAARRAGEMLYQRG